MLWTWPLPPGAFWGKVSFVGEGSARRPDRWHPVADHCVDVAAVTEALLRLPTWNRRLARLAGRELLDEATIACLAVLAGLHDLGKFNHGFQRKITDPSSGKGHVGEGLAFVDLVRDGRAALSPAAQEALGPAVCGGWGDAVVDLLRVAVCHHGRPVSHPSLDAPLWRASRTHDPVAAVRALREELVRTFGAPEVCTLPEHPAFGHGFAGLVMLADWIGSETGDHAFNYRDEGEAGAPRGPFARARAREVLAAKGLDLEPLRGPVPASFQAALGSWTPRPAQAAVGALPVGTGPSLVILESDTGSGKTEAAFARFVQLLRAGEVDGMYFAVPTRSAATQLHGRIVKLWREAVLQGGTGPEPILAVPGYLRVGALEGRPLPGFHVWWPDDPKDADRHRLWAAESSKRYLAATVAVGTIDQVLLSTLQVSHAHLRASALLRQFLVVDEVHASTPYMAELLRAVLEFHQKAGGHAMVMSATLGAGARAKIEGGRGKPGTPSRAEAEATPYPRVALVRQGQPTLTPAIALDPTEVEAKRVTLTTAPLLDDAAEVATLALSAAARGARVLVIRNLVALCLDTQRAVEEQAAATPHLLFRVNGRPAPHHARFATEDRKRLDQALEAAFTGLAPGVVAVTTQTAEQSLDIDADLLITDLAPMDVLLQRIGRLHRHDPARTGRGRPQGFAQARCVVVTPADRDLGRFLGERGAARGPYGGGKVYEDLAILEATWRMVEANPSVAIPRDNRKLVEGSVHDEVLGAIGTKGTRWWDHRNLLRGQEGARLGVAHLSQVNRAAGYADGGFPNEEKLVTRLSDSDPRLLGLPRAWRTPLGAEIRAVTVPGHMARGFPAKAEAWEGMAEEGEELVLTIGADTFRYGRWGLRRG